MTLERFERLQLVLRRAYESLEHQHLPRLDITFYESVREALLDSGASEDEILHVAGLLAAIVTRQIPADAHEVRREQYELIVEHLAVTDMNVAFDTDGQVVGVEFPEHPLPY